MFISVLSISFLSSRYVWPFPQGHKQRVWNADNIRTFDTKIEKVWNCFPKSSAKAIELAENQYLHLLKQQKPVSMAGRSKA